MSKRTEVIVQEILVSRSGQVVNMNVKLPKNCVLLHQIATQIVGADGLMEVKNRYFGVDIDGQSGAAFILSLTKEPSDSIFGEFTVTAGAGEHIYYAQPTSYGTATFSYNGLTGGFVLVGTYSVTDAETGYVDNYYLYKSVTPNLGLTTVSVEGVG